MPFDPNSAKKAGKKSKRGPAKKVGEQIIKDTTKANAQFNSIALRYFNPIGAHESAIIGELPIGTGKGSSVLEVVNTFEEVSGVKLNYSFVEKRSGDIISAYANTIKANTVLGWKSELTLKDALHSAWEWEKKNMT